MCFSCNFPAKKNTSSFLSEPDIIERLKSQKVKIDTLLYHNECQRIGYIQLSENDLPIQIDSDFVDEYYTEFVVYKDSLGKILCVSEIPYSRSGDWFLVQNHYFDIEGKTFAFTKYFNSFCINGVGYETMTEFYNADFQEINKEYSLVDEQNNSISKDSCFDYDFEYTVFPNVDKFMNFNNIQQ